MAPSMEPRLRSRGSSALALVASLKRGPFNGAAAAKPRKRRPTGPGDRCALPPSMEPRLRSRGSGTVTDTLSPVSTLQWSRSCEAAEAARSSGSASGSTTFNGAAAAKPRKRTRQDAGHREQRPSMELRLRSRGSLKVVGLTSAPCVPSMEPRLRSRGSDPHDERRQARMVAVPSMEPRLRSRGSRSRSVLFRLVRMPSLQWSRGCEAAEAPALRPSKYPGDDAAFNGAAAAKPRKPVTRAVPPRFEIRPFNGAAAAKPRKPGGAGDFLGFFPLQWSRGCEAAEARTRLTGQSNSTTFNGAAAAKPRKRAIESDLRPRVAPSMEPRLRSRGSFQPAPQTDTPAFLQWSRGCEAAEAS